MGHIVTMITIIFGSITIITLGSIWLGTSYAAKKRGYVQGATKRELEQVHQDIAQIQEDIAELKMQIADLIVATKEMT
jgi:hypothetical protein